MIILIPVNNLKTMGNPIMSHSSHCHSPGSRKMCSAVSYMRPHGAFFPILDRLLKWVHKTVFSVVSTTFALVAPLSAGFWTDNFDAGSDTWDINAGNAARQAGSLGSIPYLSNSPDSTNDYHHQLFAPSSPLQLAGDAWIGTWHPDPASNTIGLALASPNFNFNTIRGDGVPVTRVSLDVQPGVFIGGEPASFTWAAVSVGSDAPMAGSGTAAAGFSVRFVQDRFSDPVNAQHFIQLLDGTDVVVAYAPNAAGAGSMKVTFDFSDPIDGDPWNGAGDTVIVVSVNGIPVAAPFTKAGGYGNNFITLEGAANTNGFGVATHHFDNLGVYDSAQTLLRSTWTDMLHYTLQKTRTDVRYFLPAQEGVLQPGSLSGSLTPFTAGRIRGYVTPRQSGWYRFWISSGESAELWLSTQPGSKYHKQYLCGMSGELGSGNGFRIDRPFLWDVYAFQMSDEVYLEAGEAYYLESDYQFGDSGHTHVSIAWAMRGGVRQPIPQSCLNFYFPTADDADDDFLPDAWEIQYGLNTGDAGGLDNLREGEFGDYDGDGLANREEFLLGTNPANRDSDGDGFSDFDEVRSYKTNPLVSDAPSETVVGSVPVQDYAAASIGWTPLDGGIVPNSFRGSVEWDFQVPNAGVWILQLATRLRGDLFVSEEMDVKVSIDGRSLGRYTLRFGSDHRSLLRVVTPKIPRGTHRLKLEIDNLFARRQLGIESLEVRRPDGMDLDENEFPDWVETWMAGSDQVLGHPVSSRISPYCLEGHARLAGEVKVNGEPITGGADDTHWYYNLPLRGAQSTEYRVRFASGIKTLGTISWEPTNVMDGGEMVVRVGDSLKLGAWTGDSGQPVNDPDDGEPDEPTEPQTEYSWITIEGVTRRVSETRAIKHTFTTPGIVDVVVTRRDGTNPVTLRVSVLHANLPDDVMTLQNHLRYFNVTTAQAAPELFFQAGRDLRLGTRETVSANEFRFQLYPEKGGSLGVTARLWENGPIADVATILSTSLSDAFQNDAVTSELADEFPGYIIVRTPMVVTDLPPGGTVKITIFRSGIMFLDGSTVKTLTVDDMDNGIFYLEFLYPEGMDGGYCHYIDVYDANNNLLGRR